MKFLGNSSNYDWATWIIGIERSFVQGGSGAVVAGLATIGIDPKDFNLTNGLRHTLEQMGIVFFVMGLIQMFMFLQTHGAPEKIINDPKNPLTSQ